MRKTTLYILFILIGIGSAHAQSELTGDTLRSGNGMAPEMNIPDGVLLLDDVKEYDGFLLDMGMLNLTAPKKLPRFTLQVPDASKDYSYLFRPNPNVTYGRGGYNSFGFTTMPGLMGSMGDLQMGSFTLKNGMKLNTYGEYDADGNKVYNPSALPWQRNNFKGAFELKSANGAFGIRVEVQRGRENPF